MSASNNVLSILRRTAREGLEQLAVDNRGLCHELIDWIVYGNGDRPVGQLSARDAGRLEGVFSVAIKAAFGDSSHPADARIILRRDIVLPA